MNSKPKTTARLVPLIGLMMLVHSGLSYATVWEPAPNNTNVFTVNINVMSNQNFGFFSGSGPLSSPDFMLKNNSPTAYNTINFEKISNSHWNITYFDASNQQQILNASTDLFQIGFSSDGSTWVPNIEPPALLSPNAYNLCFTNCSTTTPNQIELFNVNAVPVPSALLLFGSGGILALVTSSRRRTQKPFSI